MELRHSLFHSVFQRSPEAMALSRVRDGIIVAVNKEWELLTGFSHTDAVGRTSLELGHWADPDQREQLIQTLRTHGRFNDQEATLILRDGQPRLVRLNAGTVSDGGEDYILVYLRDVTDERLAQEGLRAGERTLAQTNEKLNRQVTIYEMTETVAKVGHWVLYPGESVVHISRGYADIGRLGDVRTVPIGEHLQRVPVEDHALVKHALQNMDGTIVEHRWCPPSGGMIWLRMRMHRQIENGHVKADFGIVQDITSERRAQQALADQLAAIRESESRFRSLAALSSDWYWEQDRNLRFVRVDGNLEQTNALPVEHYIGLTRWETDTLGVSPEAWANHQATLETRQVFHDFEIQRICRDGSTMWVSISGTPMFDAQGEFCGYRGTGRDINARKQAEADIERLAFYDALTGLPNRRLLLDRLKQAVAYAARHATHGALMFIDLDNFKVLNDTLGHRMGDELLKQVAGRLSDSVRAIDTVARLGGGEFVVMLEELGGDAGAAAAQAESVGKKVLSALNAHYQLEDKLHHSTPSMGITLFHTQMPSVDELLQRADLAMYQAKAAGRNTLRFFDPVMQAAVTARAAMEVDLRLALERSEFQLYYQPVVDELRTVTGVEALLRWRHPEKGMVSPAEFIPVAEQAGLILPLGEWVLEAACAQLVSWNTSAATRRLTIAVNVSARQFRHPDFTEQLLTLLRVTGANPYRLKLELTESMLLTDIDQVIGKMSELRSIGVNFALDDFGTGYSSLSYLKRLPLDQLKIDQSFVRDVLNDPNDAVIARTILSLAQSLDLTVVAEGVETEGQRTFLINSGCKAFQGYLFGRPVPVDQLVLSDL